METRHNTSLRPLAAGWLIILSMLVFASVGRTEDLGIIEQTDVFVSGSEGYNTFRIPSTVVTNNGTVLAFCEGRKNSAADGGNIDLLLKRSSDNGKTWSNLQIVHEEGGNADIWIGNPCPVVDRTTGDIWLYCVRSFAEVLITKSTDDGVTWSQPIAMTRTLGLNDQAGSYELTGPGHGIQLQEGPHAGRLLIPTYKTIRTNGYWHCGPGFAIYSDDHGATWQVGASTSIPDDWPAENAVAGDWRGGECQVVETANGDLYMTSRYQGTLGDHPNNEFTRAFAWSRDGGATWEPFGLTDELREPECQASILRFTNEDDHDKNRILFANPANYRDGLSQQDARTNLTVRLSLDECETWSDGLLLHSGPSAYSDMAVLSDMTVGVLYERGQTTPYERITFARLKCDTLKVPETSTSALIVAGLLGSLAYGWWRR